MTKKLLPPGKIPVLSLSQPYAEAIFCKFKTWETRSWTTKHRGPLLIHASETKDKAFLQKWENLGLYVRTGKKALELDFGAIIGVVNVIDVVSTEIISDQLIGQRRTSASALDFMLGDYSPGRFAYKLESAVRLKKPVPYKGALSIWDAVKRAKEPVNLLELSMALDPAAMQCPTLYLDLQKELSFIYEQTRKNAKKIDIQ